MSPADDSGSSTPNPAETQRGSDDPIRALRPWEAAAKIELRRKLNNIALRATARAQWAASPDARQQFWTIALLAGQWTFATADEVALADIRAALLRMGTAADALERNGSGL